MGPQCVAAGKWGSCCPFCLYLRGGDLTEQNPDPDCGGGCWVLEPQAGVWGEWEGVRALRTEPVCLPGHRLRMACPGRIWLSEAAGLGEMGQMLVRNELRRPAAQCSFVQASNTEDRAPGTPGPPATRDRKGAVGGSPGPQRTSGLAAQGGRTVRAKKLNTQHGLTSNPQPCWSEAQTHPGRRV